jgi:hypothetical protein
VVGAVDGAVVDLAAGAAVDVGAGVAVGAAVARVVGAGVGDGTGVGDDVARCRRPGLVRVASVPARGVAVAAGRLA